MQLTMYGYIIIPITLILSVTRPKALVYLLILFSSFQVTGVFNIEKYEFSLQIYKWLIILISVSFLVGVFITGKIRLWDQRIYKVVTVGTLFVLYTLFMSLILPNIFRGIPVFTPTLGIDYSAVYGPQPLKLSLYNIVAPAYIVFYFVTFLYIISHSWSKREQIVVEKLFEVAFLFNLVVSISQFVSSFFELPLDVTDFFYNILQRKYTVSNMIIPRVQGLFQEPSMFSPFLIGFFSQKFYQALEFKRKKDFIFVILSLFLVPLTVSTTAFIALFIMIFVVMADTRFIRPSKNTIIINVKKLISFFFVLLVSLSLVTISLNLLFDWKDIIKIVNVATFGKIETSSFSNRMKADIHALKLLVKTYGLGVGLGSNRPSSLLPYLLSQLGLIGTFLFLVYIQKIISYARTKLKETENMGVYFLLLANLISQLIAYPDITSPTLWQSVYLTIIRCFKKGNQNEKNSQSSSEL